MTRSNWLNLNGVWQFQSGAADDPLPTGENLAGSILTPFPMESALSGVARYCAYSWYRRTFAVPTNWSGQRILLHFDAVNWRSQIYVNGQLVGTHTGGYDPFSYDITTYLTNNGPQELIARVYSPEDAGGEPRGKQTLYPAGIMFTSSSGIWQPVWLEPVPVTSIHALHLTPDIDHSRLAINAVVSGPTNGVTVKAVAYAGTNAIGVATGLPGANFFLGVASPHLWSPTDPYLYSLQVTLITNSAVADSVGSYFGMRKISVATNNGYNSIFLNNQFVFEFGPLDQGFWPDGIYTAPTDLALKSDLEMEKALGFNMVRKHIKVERQRWYYWADTLGILVWQDMPSCNSYTPSSSPPAVDPLDFILELTAMVTNHWNSPAIHHVGLVQRRAGRGRKRQRRGPDEHRLSRSIDQNAGSFPLGG
jgi:beta-galactosidase/beta-glucuronidase